MRTFEGQTTDQIASRNSGQLLAHHCLRMEAELSEMHEAHRAHVAEILAHLDDCQIIGRRVLHMKAKGRKSVRMAELDLEL